MTGIQQRPPRLSGGTSASFTGLADFLDRLDQRRALVAFATIAAILVLLTVLSLSLP